MLLLALFTGASWANLNPAAGPPPPLGRTHGNMKPEVEGNIVITLLLFLLCAVQ